jgi:endonuclease/exonuclease/phosphatase (EEP) superfamily protein YafD
MSETHPTPTQPGFLKRLALAGLNIFSTLNVGLILAYFVIRELSQNRLWFIQALHYVLPWLFTPLILLLLFAILFRLRGQVILLLLPLPLFLLTYGELYLPRLPVQTKGDSITIMTHNVWGANTQFDQILTGITTANPDLLSLHELSPPIIDALEGPLSEIYPYYRIRSWVGFFSRYPILESHAFRLGGIYGIPGPWAQHLVVDIEGVEVNVFNVHPPSPPLQGEPILGLPFRLPTHFRTEGLEIATRDILWRMEQVNGPILVVGDMNFTDQDLQYKLLTRTLEDAHRQAGWGMGFTFARFPSSGLALWRIDYVLFSEEFVARHIHLGDFNGSDHRPVIAELGWRERRE